MNIVFWGGQDLFQMYTGLVDGLTVSVCLTHLGISAARSRAARSSQVGFQQPFGCSATFGSTNSATRC